MENTKLHKNSCAKILKVLRIVYKCCETISIKSIKQILLTSKIFQAYIIQDILTTFKGKQTKLVLIK